MVNEAGFTGRMSGRGIPPVKLLLDKRKCSMVDNVKRLVKRAPFSLLKLRSITLILGYIPNTVGRDPTK